MTIVTLLCEGPACNGGLSATDRERAAFRAIPYEGEAARQAQLDLARQRATAQLTYRPHTWDGIGLHGTILYRCEACGHKRVYGTTC